MDVGIDMDYVRDWILDLIEESKLEEHEFSFCKICAYGSRTNGKANKNSDWDILLEYKGTAREDDIFNVLHEQQCRINGGRLDVNPIKADDSGTIEEYLQRCDENWKDSIP